MKRFNKVLIAAVFAIGFGLVARNAHAGSKYYQSLSTVPVNNTLSEYTANYPNVSGSMYVRKIIMSNSAPSNQQTVTIYDTCTSTTAAAVKFQTYLGTTSMVTQSIGVFDFLPQSFRLTSPCFKKNSTGSNVDFTIFYE